MTFGATLNLPLIATAAGRCARCLAVALSTGWPDFLSDRGLHGSLHIKDGAGAEE